MPRTSSKFDFNKLIKFPIQKRRDHLTKIRVAENDEVYISKKIVDSIRENDEKMRVDFRHSEDYKMIAIKLDKESSFCMPKAGTMKFREWKEILQNFGYSLPAIYAFEWNEDQRIWIGKLQEVMEAPEL